MAPIDRSRTTYYWSAIVTVALISCAIFDLFDIEYHTCKKTAVYTQVNGE